VCVQTQPHSAQIHSCLCGLILDDSPTFHLLLQRCRQPPPCLHISARTHAHTHTTATRTHRDQTHETHEGLSALFPAGEQSRATGDCLRQYKVQLSFPSTIRSVNLKLNKLLTIFMTLHNESMLHNSHMNNI